MMILTALSLLSPLSLAPVQSGPGSGVLTQSSLGGAFVSSVTPPLSGSVVAGRMLQVTLNLPGQTWQETFIIGIPAGMQGPTPLLTMFHGYGEEPIDVLSNTTLAQDAMARGWMVFIPLGAHKFNYGIDYAQENIELAFEFIGSRLPIDMDRIYGVGFSMGGGAAASFAARHLDPEGIRFAALVNHTGTASLRATYHTSNDYNLFQSPLMFGGTPDTEPFQFLRSSTVDLDPFTGAVDRSLSMGTNLSHIPTRHWYATMDANATIVEQTLALDTELRQRGGDTSVVTRSSALHSWSTLDNDAVLDWLEPHTLSAPQPGDVTRTLADRDGRWHDLEITQSVGDEMTPLVWSVQPSQNALYLIDAENLARVEFDAEEVGLNDSALMRVITQRKDGSQTDYVLHGIESQPMRVARRGQGTTQWTYDATAKTLTLHEPSGIAGWSAWFIQ